MGDVLHNKKVTLPIIVLTILLFLSGCSNTNLDKMVAMIEEGEPISIELSEPSYEISIQGERVDEIEWIQLDQLDTYDEFRKSFDELFNIKVANENGKSGSLYVDEDEETSGNTTLEDAFRNKVFVTKYWEDENVIDELVGLAPEVYTDVAENNTYSITASINAYYNLMPDAINPNSFNPTESLSREQFYALIFKTEEGVQELDIDEDFDNSIGGETPNTIFAQQVYKDGFLQIENKSLDEITYKGLISRVEAMYMLVNRHFPDILEEVTGEEEAFSDTENGGDLGSEIGFKDIDRWESYILSYMIQHQDGGMQEELYKSMVVAKDLELISSEDCRWDEPISKSEALMMIIKTYLAKNEVYGYLTEVEYGKESEEEINYKVGDGWVEIDSRRYHWNSTLPTGETLGQLKEEVDRQRKEFASYGMSEEEIEKIVALTAKDSGTRIEILDLLEKPSESATTTPSTPIQPSQQSSTPSTPINPKQPSNSGGSSSGGNTGGTGNTGGSSGGNGYSEVNDAFKDSYSEPDGIGPSNPDIRFYAPGDEPERTKKDEQDNPPPPPPPPATP